MNNSGKLLNDILNSLIREYGAQRVNNAISSISREMDTIKSDRTWNSEPKKRQKRSARQIAEALHIPEPSKTILVERLAQSFDQKEFLPTIGDIKLFLESKDWDTSSLRSRSESARLIIQLLASLSIEELKGILVNEAFFGPAQLGTLSDAISDAGNRIRREEAEDGTSDKSEAPSETDADNSGPESGGS